jgi:peptidyl-prolyl cis-trans isomerase SurA
MQKLIIACFFSVTAFAATSQSKSAAPQNKTVAAPSKSAASQNKTLDKVVAVVQGRAILLSDVQGLREQIQGSTLLRGFYSIDGGITDQTVLNRLVEDQIVRARLKELGTEISGDSVNREIEEIAKKNKLTLAQLKTVLKKQGVDFDNYFEALKSQIERRAIYNREISTSGSTLSDEELKAAFKNKAPPEMKFSVILDAANPKNKKLLEEIATQFKTGKITAEKLKSHPGYAALGWLQLEEVADHFKKLLKDPKAGEAVGPVKKDGKYQLLLVEDLRRGSDEQFEKVKERFRGSLEDVETDKKFKLWFEKQKNQLEVTVNSL